jgi:hypothetical protein
VIFPISATPVKKFVALTLVPTGKGCSIMILLGSLD